MYKKEKIKLFFVIVICFRNGYKIFKSRIVLGAVRSHYVSRTCTYSAISRAILTQILTKFGTIRSRGGLG